ncbi:hypothetical protein GR7B_00191 [Vibrio phage vB_VcorM_GR7B]|nr:hypothetical protein GR7B_00191 [Vibrio phage vB_VcorM_GR7B]
MAQAFANVPYEQVFGVSAGESADTLTAKVYSLDASGNPTEIASVATNKITVNSIIVGYLFAYTFSSTGAYIVQVTESTSNIISDSITVTKAYVDEDEFHNLLDSYANKSAYHADISSLFTQGNMESFTKANYLHYSPNDKQFTPANINTNSLTGSYVIPPGEKAAYKISISEDDNRLLCGAKFYIGGQRIVDSPGGAALPGAFKDTTVKFKIWRDLGSPNTDARFGEVLWESDDTNLSTGTYLRRVLIEDAGLPGFQYIWVDHLVFTFSDITALPISGNFLVGWEHTGTEGDNSPVVIRHSASSISSGFFYEWYYLGRTNEIRNNYWNYYGPYSQLETYTTNENAIAQIQQTLDSPLDSNVVSVTGTSVSDVDDFKSDLNSISDDITNLLETSPSVFDVEESARKSLNGFSGSKGFGNDSALTNNIVFKDPHRIYFGGIGKKLENGQRALRYIDATDKVITRLQVLIGIGVDADQPALVDTYNFRVKVFRTTRVLTFPSDPTGYSYADVVSSTIVWQSSNLSSSEYPFFSRGSQLGSSGKRQENRLVDIELPTPISGESGLAIGWEVTSTNNPGLVVYDIYGASGTPNTASDMVSFYYDGDSYRDGTNANPRYLTSLGSSPMGIRIFYTEPSNAIMTNLVNEVTEIGTNVDTLTTNVSTVDSNVSSVKSVVDTNQLLLHNLPKS